VAEAAPEPQPHRENFLMLADLYLELNVAGQCSVCGRVRDLVELPGRPEKFCLECSADLAIAVHLAHEIAAATRKGCNTEGWEAEFSEVSHRMLERSQFADVNDL
jgi:hypothetical protein